MLSNICLTSGVKLFCQGIGNIVLPGYIQMRIEIGGHLNIGVPKPFLDVFQIPSHAVYMMLPLKLRAMTFFKNPEVKILLIKDTSSQIQIFDV